MQPAMCFFTVSIPISIDLKGGGQILSYLPFPSAWLTGCYGSLPLLWYSFIPRERNLVVIKLLDCGNTGGKVEKVLESRKKKSGFCLYQRAVGASSIRQCVCWKSADRCPKVSGSAVHLSNNCLSGDQEGNPWRKRVGAGTADFGGSLWPFFYVFQIAWIWQRLCNFQDRKTYKLSNI